MDLNDETSHALMKRINRVKVLNAIRLHSPVSRSQVAEWVRLDKKSITNFVNDLEHEGLVREVGSQKPEKGRPHTLLEFPRNRMLVSGIAIEPGYVTGVQLNLYGEVCARHRVELSAEASKPEIVKAVWQAFEALKHSPSETSPALGVCVPGILDVERGLVKTSVNLPALNQTDLRSELQPLFKQPFRLEESSRSKALAEKWLGEGREARDFVAVDLGIGVGAGLVHEGRLLNGPMGFSGEIGHVMVERDGRVCRCGNRGCLETYLSEAAILEELHARGVRVKNLREVVPANAAAKEVLEQAGYRLGLGLSYLVNLLCPSLIILNGALMNVHEIFLPAVWSGLRSHGLADCVERTRLVPSQLEDAAALGAAAQSFTDFFEVENQNRPAISMS